MGFDGLILAFMVPNTAKKLHQTSRQESVGRFFDGGDEVFLVFLVLKNAKKIHHTAIKPPWNLHPPFHFPLKSHQKNHQTSITPQSNLHRTCCYFIKTSLSFPSRQNHAGLIAERFRNRDNLQNSVGLAALCPSQDFVAPDIMIFFFLTMNTSETMWWLNLAISVFAEKVPNSIFFCIHLSSAGFTQVAWKFDGISAHNSNSFFSVIIADPKAETTKSNHDNFFLRFILEYQFYSILYVDFDQEKKRKCCWNNLWKMHHHFFDVGLMEVSGHFWCRKNKAMPSNLYQTSIRLTGRGQLEWWLRLVRGNNVVSFSWWFVSSLQKIQR